MYIPGDTDLRTEEEEEQPHYQETFNPRPQHSQMPPFKHWKTYLAPELSKPAVTEYPSEYDPLQDSSHYSVPRHQLEGARSAGNLQDVGRRERFQEEHRAGRNDNYTRRKDEIMNRIKALQEKTSHRERSEKQAAR